MKTALLFGASGLSGSALLHQLLLDPRYTRIRMFNRTTIGIQDPKLEEILVDYANLDTIQQALKGDVLFSCLGTTISKAGSQSAQQMIDRDYPIAIAKIAAEQGVKCFVAVSSVGTNPNTSNFYLKTKAEMEAGIRQYFKTNLFFLRPSFLIGHRQEQRMGEKIGIVLSRIFSPLMVGGAKKYRGMPVDSMAKAMANIPFVNAASILEYEQIMQISKS